jgi:hypothetical protein
VVSGVLGSAGEPLEGAARRRFERGFGHSFNRVRVHVGPEAARSARAVNALAYTVGERIVFDHGQYAPSTATGRALLAHELAHVIQQRGAQAQPWGPRLDNSAPAHDRAAEVMAEHAITGDPTPATTAAAVTPVQLLQRAEKGTYVSTLEDPGFLDAGAGFYSSWGHPNVKRVATMDTILKDLETAGGHIESFRIVTHAVPGALFLGLMPEIEPTGFTASSAEFTTQQRFREHFTQRRIVSEEFLERIFTALQKDATTAPLLVTLGAGSTLPVADSPLGIVLRAIVDAHYLDTVASEAGGRPKVANRGVLDAFNRARLDTYSKVIIAGSPKSDRRKVTNAIGELKASLPGVFSAAGLNYNPLPGQEAADLAAGFADPNRPTTLDPALGRSIQEGADGPFLKRLRSVRAKTDEQTHIEVRGCNAGTDTGFLDSLRGFFGEPGRLPSISAPDLFQYFFKLSYTTYGAGDQATLEREYGDMATGAATGFEETQRMRAAEYLRVVNEPSLGDLAAKFGRNANRLRELNPEIADPTKLSPGDPVWLVQRKSVQAGIYKSLDDFCRVYLGDVALTPQMRAANPGVPNDGRLQPNDILTVPVQLLKAPFASDPTNLAAFQAALRGGQAVAGINTTTNRPMLYLDDAQRDKALGDWLARQRFDPKGRPAAVLSKLYAGKKFPAAAKNTYIQFLSRSYPQIEDPIFPEDPRYDKHVIRRP